MLALLLAVAIQSDATSIAARMLAIPERGHALPILARACDAGDAAACALASRVHRRGIDGSVDRRRAEEFTARRDTLLRARCQIDPRACVEIASAGAPDRGLLLRSGCARGDSIACLALSALVDPPEAQRLIGRATASLERACATSDDDACFALATHRLYDREGARRGFAACLAPLAQRCEAGSPRPCSLAAKLARLRATQIDARVKSLRFAIKGEKLRRSVARIAALRRAGTAPAERSEPIVEDDARAPAYRRFAARLAKRACAASDREGCFELATALPAWDPVGKAARLRACALGSADACAIAAQDSHDPGSRKALAERGCRLGSGAACARIGSPSRACDLGDAPSCAVIEIAGLEAQCSTGDLNACSKAGARLRDGRGCIADRPRAVRHFAHACRDGVEAQPCMAAAHLLRRGDGVPEDRARAAALYETACARGDVQGCVEAAASSHGARRVASLADACALHHAASCIAWSNELDERHEDATLALWSACAAGAADACMRAAPRLDDPVAAQHARDRACALGHAACRGAAHFD